MNTDLEHLYAELNAIKEDNEAMKAKVCTVQAQSQRERRRLRLQCGLAFCAFIAAVFVSPANRAAIAQNVTTPVTPASPDPLTLLDLRTTALANRMSVVEAKTQFQSADSTTQSTTFSGCNVIVNNGGALPPPP